MTDKLLEQVSALADDELNTREAELLLARMARDSGLRDAWGRYQLVGEAMRGALPRVQDRDLAARIAAAVEQDTVSSGRRFATARTWVYLRPFAGLAVAASVAMLAVFTLQGPQRDLSGSVVPPAGDRPAGMPLINAQQADFSGVRSQEVQDQLRSYLLNHSEHSGGSRLRGVMPYVQIAAHDARPVETAVEDPRPDAPEAGDEPRRRR